MSKMRWTTTIGLATALGSVLIGPADAQSVQYGALPAGCTGVLGYTSATLAFSCVTAGVGSVTSITAGTGLSGGSITTAGTIALDVIAAGDILANPTGSSAVPVPTMLRGATLVQWPDSVVVANGTYFEVLTFPWATGTIDTVTAVTNGSATPSFTAGITIAGTPVTSCATIAVGTIGSTATCTGANTLVQGNYVGLIVTNVSGTPDLAAVQVNWHHSVQ